MDIFNKQVNLDNFFSELAKNKNKILFLDYDGTLSGFTSKRDGAVPYPGVIDKLRTLTDSATTRLVIISGRTLADLKSLLKLDRYPELIGGHGTERLKPGQINIEIDLSAKAKEGLTKAKDWAIQNGFEDYSEFKVSGISFHWRGIADDKREHIKEKVNENWQKKASQFDLELHEFDGGIELRYSKMNKGVVVKSLISEHNDISVIAYLGDDRTDEEAFEAIGKKGLKVLVRNDLRSTKADLRISPPDELLEFLDRWIKTEE
jgi:trehalose-phosphatase